MEHSSASARSVINPKITQIYDIQIITKRKAMHSLSMVIRNKTGRQGWWREKSINTTITMACIAGGSKQNNEQQCYDEKKESLSD